MGFNSAFKGLIRVTCKMFWILWNDTHNHGAL